MVMSVESSKIESKTFSVKTSAALMLPSKGPWSETNLNVASLVVSELLDALLSVVVVSNALRLGGGFKVIFSDWQIEDGKSRATLNNK